MSQINGPPVTRRSFKSTSAKASSSVDKGATALKKISLLDHRFMADFNPETSVREKRKLHRKLVASSRKVVGAVYDENGVHMTSGQDMCDCLVAKCPGCHFPCPKCNSQKCGNECRSNRKYIYDQIDFEGCDINIENPLAKT